MTILLKRRIVYKSQQTEEIQNLLNAIHSQGRSVREVTELLEKNII